MQGQTPLQEKKVAPGSMEGKADTSLTEENKSSTYVNSTRTCTEEYFSAYRSGHSETWGQTFAS